MNIKFLLRYKILFNMIKNPSYFLNSKKYIFILSHMRSYSTLLSHILGSNEKICGYTEMHIPYYSSLDLQILKFNARNRYKEHTNKKFLLDKILHNDTEISENILNSNNISTIFLLREPVETIISTILMRSNLYNRIEENGERKAAHYYIKRLKTLKNYSELTKGKNIFLKIRRPYK